MWGVWFFGVGIVLVFCVSLGSGVGVEGMEFRDLLVVLIRYCGNLEGCWGLEEGLWGY